MKDLIRAAELLRDFAADLAQGHNSSANNWAGDTQAQASYDEMLALAMSLEQTAAKNGVTSTDGGVVLEQEDKPSNTPSPGKPWFSYCPENGFTFHSSRSEALVHAHNDIDGWLDDYWHEEVEHICVGLLTHVATQVDLRKRPAETLDENGCDATGDYWDPDWEFKCGYKPLPVGGFPLTNFEEVSLFNELIGNKKGQTDRLHKQFEIIESEFKELSDAIRDRDWTSVRDGICDVLVTTYGLGHIIGMDVDLDMAEVAASNRSKFCDDAEAANAAARELSTKLGIRVAALERGNNKWALIAQEDGPDAPKGKLLKGPEFHKPCFKEQHFPDFPVAV